MPCRFGVRKFSSLPYQSVLASQSDQDQASAKRISLGGHKQDPIGGSPPTAGLNILGSVKVRPAVPSLGILALQLALQKERESVERDIGHVMLDALGIEFRALLGDADGAQKIDNEPMPGADAIGETMPFRR